MRERFKRLSILEFSVYGDKLFGQLVCKRYLNFLLEIELLPEFYKQIQNSKDFKQFSQRLRLSVPVAVAILSDMKVLPNDNSIISLFKQWRADIDNQEIIKQIRSQLKIRLKNFLLEDSERL